MEGYEFPISRDPPEGGTNIGQMSDTGAFYLFPISRDPPEGGTSSDSSALKNKFND